MSVEDLLIKLATGTGSTGLAMFLAYILYKFLMARQAREFEKQANEPSPSGQPTQRLSSNPNLQTVDDCVPRSHCEATQSAVKERFDSIKVSLTDTSQRIDKRMDSLEKKVDKATEKMSDSVVELKEAVAVLKDRNERDSS